MRWDSSRGKLTAEVLDNIPGFLSHAPPARMAASTALDLERGNRLELPWLNGKIAALGRELGIPAPTHSLIYAMQKPYVMGAPR